jgi:hypothetical protein
MRQIVSYVTEVQFIDLALSESDVRRYVLHSVKIINKWKRKVIHQCPEFLRSTLVKNPTKEHKNSSTVILKILLFMSDWKFHFQMFIVV